MTDPFPAAPDFLVLHALRLKGLAEADALATATGLGRDGVGAATACLEAAGLAQHRTGVVGGWMLTPNGRDQHRRRLEAELEAAGCRDQIDGSYRRLLILNEPFKALCTAWQLRRLDPPVANDHTDPGYDTAVVARLVAMHADARAVADELAGALPRFGAYAARLDDALARVQAGAPDAFTKPLTGSYHDVWMELHEDLLLTLGIARREGST